MKNMIINDKILSEKVRVIDEQGNNIGVVLTSDAIKTAKQKGLDLVQLSTNSAGAVCKYLDYSQYRYDLQKKHKENKKNQRRKRVQLKELYMRPVTDTADVDRQIKKGIQFLQDGHKVKFGIKFKGRENTHKELGYKLLSKVKDELSEYCKIDRDIAPEGRTIILLVSPVAKLHS